MKILATMAKFSKNLILVFFVLSVELILILIFGLFVVINFFHA